MLHVRKLQAENNNFQTYEPTHRTKINGSNDAVEFTRVHVMTKYQQSLFNVSHRTQRIDQMLQVL